MNDVKYVTCKLCGYERAVEYISEVFMPVPKADSVKLLSSDVECPHCQDEYHSSDDPDLEKKVKDVESRSFATMLNDLVEKNGFQMATVERAYGIPYRTLSRWKTQGVSTKADLALIRVSHDFPFLITHAANGYKKEDRLRLALEFVKDGYRAQGIDIEHTIVSKTRIQITAVATYTSDHLSKQIFGESVSISGSDRIYGTSPYLPIEVPVSNR